MRSMKIYVLGIDIGGTNIKFGLVNSLGQVILRTRFATKNCSRQRESLIKEIIRQSQDIIQKKRISSKELLGIGVGVPGLIDCKKGIVKSITNIHGWENVPLARILTEGLRKRVVVDNDVNLITLGEWKYGAGKGLENLVCLTLGTGVGGGLILNNALYRGEGFTAGECGHMPLKEGGRLCNCGGRGCLEKYIGNQALLKKARNLFRNKEITLEEVTALARRGNKKAKQFWADMGGNLGN